MSMLTSFYLEFSSVQRRYYNIYASPYPDRAVLYGPDPRLIPQGYPPIYYDRNQGRLGNHFVSRYSPMRLDAVRNLLKGIYPKESHQTRIESQERTMAFNKAIVNAQKPQRIKLEDGIEIPKKRERRTILEITDLIEKLHDAILSDDHRVRKNSAVHLLSLIRRTSTSVQVQDVFDHHNLQKKICKVSKSMHFTDLSFDIKILWLQILTEMERFSIVYPCLNRHIFDCSVAKHLAFGWRPIIKINVLTEATKKDWTEILSITKRSFNATEALRVRPKSRRSLSSNKAHGFFVARLTNNSEDQRIVGFLRYHIEHNAVAINAAREPSFGALGIISSIMEEAFGVFGDQWCKEFSDANRTMIMLRNNNFAGINLCLQFGFKNRVRIPAIFECPTADSVHMSKFQLKVFDERKRRNPVD